MQKPKPRNLFLYNQFNQKSIEELTKSLVDILDDDKRLKKEAMLNNYTYDPAPIKIYIDSYGGSVYQGLGIISIIESAETEIHTICTGTAMSCGFLLLISGHKRFCYPKSTVMAHSISDTLWGDIKTIEDEIVETKRLDKVINNHITEYTNITKKKIKKVRNHKKNWYMDAKQALKYNVVDEIIE